MPIVKHARLLGAAAVLTSVSTLAMAQAQTQTPPSPTSPPAATPPTATPPAAKPTPAPTPATPARPSAQAPAKTNPLIGLSVFSSDGSRLGSVQSVNAEPDGKVKAIHIKSGGSLVLAARWSRFPRASLPAQVTTFSLD